MQERVSAAARWVAGQLEAGLERRLRETYGAGWLEAVNERRRAEGYRPGESLRDHRFCLAVFAYDPATQGWVAPELRRRARVLLGLANAAAHDDVGPDDLERAREIVALFAEHLGVDPPADLLADADPVAEADPLAGADPVPDGLGERRVDDRRRAGDRRDAVEPVAPGAAAGRRPSGPPPDIATRVRRARQRWAQLRRRPRAWVRAHTPRWAKPAAIGVLVVAGVVGAAALVHAHGVAALLALPFIVALVVALTLLALYLSLWVLALGGLGWSIFLFTQHENLSGVIFLWVSVLAGFALGWLHEDVLG
ncbi:MAG TPA: hypothetical protein VIL48_08680 [Acidimicrobiales bacterium]